jgi:hypothetical protein
LHGAKESRSGGLVAQYGTELHAISAGGTPIYRFIDHDVDTIRLQRIGEKEQYILIPKQSLEIFAKAFARLAKDFTI